MTKDFFKKLLNTHITHFGTLRVAQESNFYLFNDSFFVPIVLNVEW